MGLVYSPTEVLNGRVPSIDGMDHLEALHFYFDNLTDPDAPTANNIRLLMLGSVVTGQATRRSDLDKFLVVGSPLGDHPNEDLELSGRQLLHIKSVERATTKKYNVHIEGKTFTERELWRFGKSIGEPSWVSHCVHIQDEFSDFSYRSPFNDFDSGFRKPDGTIGYVSVPGLRNYSIDLDQLDDPRARSMLLSNVMMYFNHKEQLFSDAGYFNPDRAVDLHRFQRALEFAKAATRKALAISALEGYDINGADVTSKSSMLDHAAQIIDRIDHKGQIQIAISLIAELDREYDEVLDEAVTSGNVGAYEKWLADNYLPTCAASLFLNRCFYRYADNLSWSDPTIVLDMADQDYGELFEDSAGEALDDMNDFGFEPSVPILVNLDQNQIYDLTINHQTMRPKPANRQIYALAA